MSLHATSAPSAGLCYQAKAKGKRRHKPGQDILGRGRERLCNLRFKLTHRYYPSTWPVCWVCITWSAEKQNIDETGQTSQFHYSNLIVWWKVVSLWQVFGREGEKNGCWRQSQRNIAWHFAERLERHTVFLLSHNVYRWVMHDMSRRIGFKKVFLIS